MEPRRAGLSGARQVQAGVLATGRRPGRGECVEREPCWPGFGGELEVRDGTGLQDRLLIRKFDTVRASRAPPSVTFRPERASHGDMRGLEDAAQLSDVVVYLRR